MQVLIARLLLAAGIWAVYWIAQQDLPIRGTPPAWVLLGIICVTVTLVANAAMLAWDFARPSLLLFWIMLRQRTHLEEARLRIAEQLTEQKPPPCGLRSSDAK
jgi:hypothetical protein